MKRPPLISFIVPVYNTEKTLCRCIKSIINQSETDFEIIIVNDGSKDNSQFLINDFLEKHKYKIISIIKDNSGLSEARNYGIKKASGQYIAFVDSDDYIEPEYVKDLKYSIEKYSPDLLYINYNRIYIKKRNLFERFYRFGSLNKYYGLISLKLNREIICDLEVASWLRVVKRSIFINNESMFFSAGRVYEDLEASLKWYLHLKNILVLNKPYYNYMITSNSLNFSGRNLEHFKYTIDSVIQHYRENDSFEEYKEELEYVFAKHLLLSNLLRLKFSKQNRKFLVFMELREKLLEYFPNYDKNRYLKNNLFYINSTLKLTKHFPSLFKFILR